MYEEICDALDWKTTHTAANIQQSYQQMVYEAFGIFLAKCKASSLDLYLQLYEAFEKLNSEGVERVLGAPETTYRLFFCRDGILQTANFLLIACDAELARVGVIKNPLPVLWTALGDHVFIRNNDTATSMHQQSWLLNNQIPVDFISPYARKISLNEDEYGEIDPSIAQYEVAAYTPKQISTILAALDNAANKIADVAPNAWDLIEIGTRVLIIRRNPLDSIGFSSSTSGTYVGRSMLVNPHNTDNNLCTIADGLVHESIHGILYMAERHGGWLLDDNLFFSKDSFIVSPWSGNKLFLRPFMQACFVWYGLLKFWSHPKATENFTSASEHFKKRALSGFTKGSLVDRLGPWRKSINDEIVASIDLMQSRAIL